jgi:hypothetical protein
MALVIGLAHFGPDPLAPSGLLAVSTVQPQCLVAVIVILFAAFRDLDALRVGLRLILRGSAHRDSY